MSEPYFGVTIRRIDEEPRPVWGADLSTIGIVGPAEGADATAFPLNTPVLVRTNQSLLINKLGTQGYLRDALNGIADQLGEMQRAARCVVVRTAASTATDPTAKLNQTIGNVVGEKTQHTGLFALLKAASVVGFIPRIVIVPGYTGQTSLGGSVGRIVQTSRGSGYVAGDSYALTPTGGTPTTPLAAHAIGMDDGSLGDAVIDEPGAGYTSAPAITAAAPPAGTGNTTATFTAHLALVANPVVAALPAVCGELFAHAIVESSGISEQNDIDWRGSMQSERLIPIVGGCRVLDSRTGLVRTRPLAPRIAGIAVRRDFERGAPFHSWANQPVQGIVGTARELEFSLMDGDNEGQELLQRGLGILIRGEAGSDFAIAAGGFVFVGTDNASEDDIWKMYNVTRGRDYIHIGLVRALRFYLGRFNITAQLVQALINTMSFFLRDLQADEHILGWRAMFVADRNSAEEIRLGHIVIGFKAEEPPVLRRITTESARFREAIDIMVAQLEQQLGIAA